MIGNSTGNLQCVWQHHSVSPADEIRKGIKLAAPEKNEQGFIVQIPNGFKSLKIKDTTKVANPRQAHICA